MAHSGALATWDSVAVGETVSVSNPASEGVPRMVEAALWASQYPELGRLRCEPKRGALVLIGKVSSYFLKQVAQAIASKVACERQLVNRIHVEYAADGP